MAYYIIFLLKLILNTKVIYHGKENLKKVDKFFIASAHQSMFETFVLQAPLNFPVFILRIPLFGWYLRKIDSIEITRQITTKDNINFFNRVKESILKINRPLLIFPQGTRTKIGERVPFKKGIGRIYNTLNLPCIPVALNSGKIWPKNSFMKYAGDIHISFLEPIMPGKQKEEFIRDIENRIYLEIEKLN